MGVVRRRRFGIEHGRITAYEDEHLTDPTEHEGRSAILAREIERPRVGPMRDIAATIQPEQDEIVRAGAGTTVCVQGAPGTGKTAVGLHRAAWLLYAHRDKLARAGVLVVGPNSAFLEHVGAVVPPRGSRRWRLPAYHVKEIVEELRGRGARYGAAREMLAHRLAHAILVLMEEAGDSPDDRVQDAVARSRDVRRYVDLVWPSLEPRGVLYRLFTDVSFLVTCTAGILTDDEAELLLWS